MASEGAGTGTVQVESAPCHPRQTPAGSGVTGSLGGSAGVSSRGPEVRHCFSSGPSSKASADSPGRETPARGARRSLSLGSCGVAAAGPPPSACPALTLLPSSRSHVQQLLGDHGDAV